MIPDWNFNEKAMREHKRMTKMWYKDLEDAEKHASPPLRQEAETQQEEGESVCDLPGVDRAVVSDGEEDQEEEEE